MNRVTPLALAMLLSTTGASTGQVVAPVPADAGRQPVFKAESQLVVLHASVRDGRGRYVSGLTKDAFTVIDDGQPQALEMFSSDDVPASIGLLIDNSNSMGPSRARVIAAVMAFAHHSHPQDEVFVLTVNEHVREAWGPSILSARPLPEFESAVTRAITARGMTALYDGITAGLDRVSRGAHSRQVLIVVSDGGDNASKASQADMVRDAQASDAVIYTVALTDAMTKDGDPGLLRRLARETGGEAFEPRHADQVPQTLEQIARDIRSAYTLAYVPTAGLGQGTERRRRAIRVYVRPPDGRPLRVRARDGYFTPGGGHD